MIFQSEKNLRRFLGLLLIVILYGPLGAQPDWKIQHFGLADGLPDRSVVRVVQDSLGFRWLATETGLYRFDGHRFDQPPFLEKLLIDGENVIRDMTTDRLGRIITWTGGSDFLQWIDSRTNEVARLNKPPSPSPKAQLSHFLIQFPQALSALQTEGEVVRLFQLDPLGNWQPTLETNHFTKAAEGVRYLGQSSQSEYFFYYPEQGEVSVFDSEGIIRSISLLDSVGSTPGLLQLDSQGRLWWQPKGEQQLQLCLPGQQSFTPFEPLQRADDTRYNKFYEDQRGNLIFGAIGPTLTTALVRLDAHGAVTDLGRILRTERKIVAISGSDFSQGFDLATYGGYYRVVKPFDRLGATNYLAKPEEVNRSSYRGRIMRGFTEGADGTLYGNTEGAMWLRLSPPTYQLDTFYPWMNGQPLPPQNIGAGHNLITAGGYIYGFFSERSQSKSIGYLTRFDPQTEHWQHYPIPLEGGFGRFVLALPDGDLLVFAFRRSDRLSQIYRFNPKEENFWFFGAFNVDLPRRSRTSAQNAIYDPGRNLVWLAAGNGLFAYQPCLAEVANSGLGPKNQPCYFDSTKTITYPEINFHVQSLLLNPDGTLLLSTLGEGVQIFDPDRRELKILAYDPSQLLTRGSSIDLPSNQVAEMVRLDSQHLVITTFNGVVVADLDSRRSLFYATEDGLPNNEFNRQSAFLSSRGELLLGGINGFSRIAKEKLLAKPTGPTPQLSRYYTFDEDQRGEVNYYPRPAQQEQIVIPPGQAYLGFNFTTPGSENLTYRSWLEGYEIDYGLANTSGQVEYLRVPAGRYTLHVEATNQLGESSAEPLKIPIRVKRPWYFRPWFLILCQLLLIGGGVLIYRNRVQRIRAQEAEKSRVSRQLAELEMKILRQQLNPHFIFNALGAIQHFIQGMQGPDAMEYLADFAKLMRMFLECSKQSYIFLNDELKLIKLYVRLEQLRFNNKFDVHYEIDPDLDLEMEDIPSLLLQPFVENAINHGLFHLKRRGNLTIGMRMDEAERIIITIADDGIGRKAAAELRAKTYKKHKSRATQIVEERLEIFQRTAETDVKISTEDLHPERSETGTKVIVVVEGS